MIRIKTIKLNQTIRLNIFKQLRFCLIYLKK